MVLVLPRYHLKTPKAQLWRFLYIFWSFKSNNNHLTFLSLFLFISASFYGSGHASLPFEDAQSTTDLSFRFRTSRAEALLVLVAGRTDYCLVMLQAGAVKVREIWCPESITCSSSALACKTPLHNELKVFVNSKGEKIGRHRRPYPLYTFTCFLKYLVDKFVYF